MRLSEVMRHAQAIIDDVCKRRETPLYDKGTDRLLADLGESPVIAESERLTRRLWPEREDHERFDEFTGPFADESGASAGAGGVS